MSTPALILHLLEYLNRTAERLEPDPKAYVDPETFGIYWFVRPPGMSPYTQFTISNDQTRALVLFRFIKLGDDGPEITGAGRSAIEAWLARRGEPEEAAMRRPLTTKVLGSGP